jgi:hypothetical protein
MCVCVCVCVCLRFSRLYSKHHTHFTHIYTWKSHYLTYMYVKITHISCIHMTIARNSRIYICENHTRFTIYVKINVLHAYVRENHTIWRIYTWKSHYFTCTYVKITHISRIWWPNTFHVYTRENYTRFTYIYIYVCVCVCVCVKITSISCIYMWKHTQLKVRYTKRNTNNSLTHILCSSFPFRCLFHDAVSIPAVWRMITKECGRKRPWLNPGIIPASSRRERR